MIKVVFLYTKYNLKGFGFCFEVFFLVCREIYETQQNGTVVCNQTIPFNVDGKTPFYFNSRISQEPLDSSWFKLGSR